MFINVFLICYFVKIIKTKNSYQNYKFLIQRIVKNTKAANEIVLVVSKTNNHL